MSQTVENNVRQEPDELLNKIADYALNFNIESEEALLTARYCLMDTLGCGILALSFPDCKDYLVLMLKAPLFQME